MVLEADGDYVPYRIFTLDNDTCSEAEMGNLYRDYYSRLSQYETENFAIRAHYLTDVKL